MTGRGTAFADLPFLDLARFERLMQMVGPDMGPELLARLEDDLAAVAAGLRRAMQDRDQPDWGQPDWGGQPDWAELRGQTHVLIALAGTVGALRLQHLAEALNREAHERSGQDVAQATRMLAALLDELLQHVRDCRAGNVPGATW
ncbi:hypothetical protein GEU84_007615 [Fertoebacter nigrum]|uniref:HPt domain-containing protein n=1 Tax=Fertoeibacter niger TaxID=2656921 RepID=A0A8X8GZQ0_9RHOB|nr:hypothetical protein [Fertoeibacter niger]NUB44245.1 hypothetical protein [Fertoeibacter niger]